MLNNEAEFYHSIRRSKLFGPVFETKEFEGVREIIKDCSNAGWSAAYTAYALATAYHETAHTMQPVKEYGGTAYYMRKYDVTGDNPTRARKYGNTASGDGAKYAGRGYVQLTWKVNYAKASTMLGIDLVNYPDRAMDPDIASDIMIGGMEQGWFTGKALRHYLPSRGTANRAQFKKARYVINGTDKADLIADYALRFQEALIDGNWQ